MDVLHRTLSVDALHTEGHTGLIAPSQSLPPSLEILLSIRTLTCANLPSPAIAGVSSLCCSCFLKKSEMPNPFAALALDCGDVGAGAIKSKPKTTARGTAVVPKVEHAGEDSANILIWACSGCTFENPADFLACTMCDKLNMEQVRIFEEQHLLLNDALAPEAAAAAYGGGSIALGEQHRLLNDALAPEAAAAAYGGGSIAPSAQPPQASWCCPSCTFDNPADLLACSICDTLSLERAQTYEDQQLIDPRTGAPSLESIQAYYAAVYNVPVDSISTSEILREQQPQQRAANQMMDASSSAGYYLPETAAVATATAAADIDGEDEDDEREQLFPQRSHPARHFPGGRQFTGLTLQAPKPKAATSSTSGTAKKQSKCSGPKPIKATKASVMQFLEEHGWTLVRKSGHMIYQRKLANGGPCQQISVPSSPSDVRNWQNMLARLRRFNVGRVGTASSGYDQSTRSRK